LFFAAHWLVVVVTVVSAGQVSFMFGNKRAHRMAGLHFSCGKWLGEDKSADPFFEVAMDDLPFYLLPVEKEAWAQQVEPFFWEPLGEPGNQVRIPPAIMRLLSVPARRYRAELAEDLGLSGPEATVDEIVAFPTDREATEFRYRCVVDLIRAAEECERSGEPVAVTFC
jgi:hypothetical protein